MQPVCKLKLCRHFFFATIHTYKSTDHCGKCISDKDKYNFRLNTFYLLTYNIIRKEMTYLSCADNKCTLYIMMDHDIHNEYYYLNYYWTLL